MRPYRPQGRCVDVWRATQRQVLVSGPAGTGKSRAILEKIHYLADNFVCRILIARQTRDSMTDSVLVTFEDEVVPPGHPCIGGIERKNRHSYLYPNGSEIVLGGFNKDTRFLSSQYDVVYIPEATEVSLKSWDTVISRLRNFKLPVHQLIADCNPDSDTHWLYLRFLDGGLRLIETTHEDNPVLYDETAGKWTPQGLEYIATLDLLTGNEKERLRHGRWVAPPGQVYSCFDKTKHRVPRFVIPKTWRRFYGVDFGDVNAAAVCLAEHPTEKCVDGWPVLYAYRSYWPSQQLTTAAHVAALMEREGDGWAMVAAAGGNKPTESAWRREWGMAGLPVAEPRVSVVDVQVQRTFDTIERGGLKFFNDCHTLIGHVTGLRRVLDGFGKPVDGKYANDTELHLAAALRYIVSHVRYETKAKTKVHSPFMKDLAAKGRFEKYAAQVRL